MLKLKKYLDSKFKSLDKGHVIENFGLFEIYGSWMHEVGCSNFRCDVNKYTIRLINIINGKLDTEYEILKLSEYTSDELIIIIEKYIKIISQ